MQSKAPIMPLQLIYIFLLIFLLPPAFSTGIIAEPGCRDLCGNLSIPYPFRVGSNCFFNPSYDIACNTSTDPPKAYLTLINAEVIEINKTYIRVKYLDLVSACYDLSGGPGTNATAAASFKHSQSANLSGTPYTMSYGNRVTAIGCDDMLLVVDGTDGGSVSGGCSAFCVEKNDSGGVGYCPNNATSLGNGCCQAFMFRDNTAGFLEGAQLIDMSQKFQRRKLFPCSYTFIQETDTLNEMAFSYPLYYLDNSTTMLNDNWAPVVQLDWMIGAENCSQAKLNSTYACRDERSVCVDFADNDYFGTGYQCRCVQGYEGNPYLPGGCKPISFTSSIAKAGCKDQCGKLSIPFPFGIGRDCYREPSFEITCNTSTNPPKAYLTILNAEVIELNSTLVLANYETPLGLACYNLSKYKTEEHGLIIDLSGTQYTLSNENWITAIGCDDMMVGNIRQGNRSFIGSGCSTVCSNYSYYYGNCPSGNPDSNGYWPGDGRCLTSIPKGTTYLEANLSDFSGQWRRKKLFSCSYAFVGFKSEYFSYPLEYLNNSTVSQSDELPDKRWRPTTLMALDWRIGAINCKEAQLDAVNFGCKANTDCIDFDTTVGGYLCNCSIGYEGNPYLDTGCQDINECVDHTINPCDSNSICISTAGSFHCSCRKGYSGDGRKDGKGCIQRRLMASILTGVLSGLGSLFFILLCFWSYKVIQKRKEQMLKEKFFKRNGGLLLRKQTNKNTLVNTKLFISRELEIATDHFNESRILGSGGQGTVFKGMLSDGKIVAIKKSRLVEEDQLEQFINEVVILSRINHRNVVKLLGYCLETEVPLLVYEFMPNGTLFDLIHDSNNEFPISWNMRLKIAADVAGALAYLRSASSIPIYHRDIKSSNILLDEKFIVKVSDFGTSRSINVDQTHLTTMVKGTFGYLDPEYFQSRQFTEKRDVYSFGVVIVELLPGQRPISLDKTDELRGLATRFLTSIEENNLDTILDRQVLDQGRKEEVILVVRLAQRCLNLKGKMRPTMKEVATELESFRISQMSIGVKDEFEEVGAFEDMPTMISDIEYTWTSSYKNPTASLSDTNSLIFTTK